MPEHLSSNLCIVTVFLSRSLIVLVSKLLPKVGHNLAQPIQASCMPMRKSTMVIQTDRQTRLGKQQPLTKDSRYGTPSQLSTINHVASHVCELCYFSLVNYGKGLGMRLYSVQCDFSANQCLRPAYSRRQGNEGWCSRGRIYTGNQ